jgi:hypothetical protein
MCKILVYSSIGGMSPPPPGHLSRGDEGWNGDILQQSSNFCGTLPIKAQWNTWRPQHWDQVPLKLLLLPQREVGAAPPFNQHLTASVPHLRAPYKGQPQDRTPSNTSKNKRNASQCIVFFLHWVQYIIGCWSRKSSKSDSFRLLCKTKLQEKICIFQIKCPN